MTRTLARILALAALAAGLTAAYFGAISFWLLAAATFAGGATAFAASGCVGLKLIGRGFQAAVVAATVGVTAIAFYAARSYVAPDLDPQTTKQLGAIIPVVQGVVAVAATILVLGGLLTVALLARDVSRDRPREARRALRDGRDDAPVIMLFVGPAVHMVALIAAVTAGGYAGMIQGLLYSPAGPALHPSTLRSFLSTIDLGSGWLWLWIVLASLIWACLRIPLLDLLAARRRRESAPTARRATASRA